MSYISDAQFLQDLTDTLKKGNITLTTSWANLAPQAHSRGYSKLVSTLLGRGFLAAQITAWDDGAVYERDLSLYFALVRGGVLDAFDAKFIELLDVRKEICALTAIPIGGVWQPPGGTAGQAEVGAIDTSTDLFGPAWDGDDPRIGKPIRW